MKQCHPHAEGGAMQRCLRCGFYYYAVEVLYGMGLCHVCYEETYRENVDRKVEEGRQNHRRTLLPTC